MSAFRSISASAARIGWRLLVCVSVSAALFVPPKALADEIRVQIEVESRDVYMGESFLMQISVIGSDKADPPDLSGIDNFTVEYLGGSNNSSHSITIINGRMKRIVNRSFVFRYNVTPEKVGRLTIPPIRIDVEGKAFTTRPVTISARRPEETDEFKLRIELSRETCYIGEPVVLTVTWYIRKDVEDFRFSAPLFGIDHFDFETPEVDIDRQKKYYRIQIGGRELVAEKGRGILGGGSYATLKFSIAIIPRRAGVFIIPEFVVACQSGGAFGGRDFFRDFFSDDFFRTSRTKPRKHVIPSNTLSITVRELPTAGRPERFYGHIGEYRISTKAAPVDVHVGDPITLTIALEGSDYPGIVDLPPLKDVPGLADGFRIPDERADGRVEGKKKIFTQTIRALNESVAEIPPVSLVYFDTKTGRYETVASKPIPITVRPTRVVTALDAEGVELAPAGSPVEKWKEGIAYNYEGPGVVAPQDVGLRSVITVPGWLAALIAPPALYFILLAGLAAARKRSADPGARRAKGAMRRLGARLDTAAGDSSLTPGRLCQEVMDAFRTYLGEKLRSRGSALTTGDMESMLRAIGVPGDLVREVKDLMSSCEAGAYAGVFPSAGDREELVGKVREMARRLERKL